METYLLGSNHFWDFIMLYLQLQKFFPEILHQLYLKCNIFHSLKKLVPRKNDIA